MNLPDEIVSQINKDLDTFLKETMGGSLLTYPELETAKVVYRNGAMQMAVRLVKQMLDSMRGQDFADWYSEGRFDDWVRGEENAPSTEEILEDLAKYMIMGGRR